MKSIKVSRKNASKFHVATFNCRTLQTDIHLLQMTEALRKIKYDIVGLSEVKREDEEILETTDFTLCTKTNTRRRGSIGFIVRKKWKIKQFTALNDRVAALVINVNEKTFGFLQCYAPTSAAKDDEIDEFYMTVIKGLKEVESCDWSIVMGDWNAKVGECGSDTDVMGKFGFGTRNERGEKLIRFARTNKLFIANSMFEKNQKRRSTWSLGKASNEIDFIMIKNDQKRFMRNIDVLNKFEYESDHKMVRLTLSLESKKKRPFSPPIKKFLVSDDKKRIEEFQTKLKSKPPTNGSLQEKYEHCSNAILTAGEVFKHKTVLRGPITQETKLKIQEREKLRREKDNDEKTKQAFRETRKEVNKMIQRDVRKFETDKMEAAIRDGLSWKEAKQGFRKDMKNWIPKLRDKNGKLETDRDKILEVAASYYENLYSSRLNRNERENLEPELTESLDDQIEEISIEEMEVALSNLKNKKAVGEDQIPTELLKICDAQFLDELRKVFNEILKTEIIPNEWLCSTIILFFKKGDRTELKNYRPISKTSHMYKLFMKIIANRLSETLEEHQSVNQAGCRSGFSTTDHLFVIQQLIEKSTEHNLDLYMGFVDYEKAFDSIEHPYLWLAMREQGINTKYIRLMKKIYENSSAKIQMEKQSRTFKIGRGVKQGCCLSPKLFNGALQKVFNGLDWSQKGLKIDEKHLAELRFVDDVVVISPDKNELVTMMEELFDASKEAGLCANIEKTKVMCNTGETLFTIHGKQVEAVNEYKYLGSLTSFEDREEKEINARIAAAWRSFWAMSKFFQSDMPIYHKTRLMDSCILPSFTYNCQCWSLNEKSRDRLAVEQRNMERKMMKIKKINHVRNAKMRNHSKIEDVIDRAKELKWNWAGHAQRLEDKRWAKVIERWKPVGTRKRGRPKMRWQDEIQQHAGILWRRKTIRREIWKKLGKSFV